MRNWNQLKERFLRDGVPIRLGELASNLSRIKSFSYEESLQQAVEQMLQESKFFVEWTIGEVEANVAVELNELYAQLTRWEKDFSGLWADLDQRTEMSEQARKWSDRILERSDLLSESVPLRKQC
ncbi:hypothetical protein ACKFKF_20085 [Phormidesmis sp. 146-12]